MRSGTFLELDPNPDLEQLVMDPQHCHDYNRLHVALSMEPRKPITPPPPHIFIVISRSTANYPKIVQLDTFLFKRQLGTDGAMRLPICARRVVLHLNEHC
jgi:hypothetical protein